MNISSLVIFLGKGLKPIAEYILIDVEKFSGVYILYSIVYCEIILHLISLINHYSFEALTMEALIMFGFTDHICIKDTFYKK